MHRTIPTGIAIALSIMSARAAAQPVRDPELETLEARVAAMESELNALRTELEQARQEASSDDESLRAELTAANATAQRAESNSLELTKASSVTHLAGYASIGYTDIENGTDAFNVGNFNPVFHFQYQDRVLWESELEIEVEEDGDTAVHLEYSAIDVFLNDYLTFVGGKFLSPIGNFRQNLHPAWINKLPSAPPGFGHDGAAPVSEVGLQLRGGAPVGDSARVTYSTYVGNGPRLEAEDGELHGVEAEGFSTDDDGEKVWGGRVSFLPLPRLELGVSAAFGDAAITSDDGVELVGDPLRDYTVRGFDLTYQWDNFDLRAEYVQTEVGNAAGSVAEEGAKWETWYVQGSYKFAGARWEAVLRYADYTSPQLSQRQEQTAVGLNYLIGPSAIAKLGYEFNDGAPGLPTDDDRIVLQLAYGY